MTVARLNPCKHDRPTNCSLVAPAAAQQYRYHAILRVAHTAPVQLPGWSRLCAGIDCGCRRETAGRKSGPSPSAGTDAIFPYCAL